ncbi:MAG: hypothetical protein IJT54_05780 [Candidatus Methanomethylophilaceae archaeon]|nr:hypothetical protein [Candidatus Methanomethylophilaceae archaeon]
MRNLFLLLSWSHYPILFRVCDDRACEWYEKEATEDIWSVHTLQRNVDSQYYYRIVSC